MSKVRRVDPITAFILSALPEVEAVITQSLSGGASLDDIVDMVVGLVDDSISWSAVPAPWGAIIEAGDGPLLKLVIKALVKRIEKSLKK